ncbi:MAG: ATP-binding protein [Oscillospiraceae bacterium]|nr:ATP-binding protein [Oscillospiraceae bacterium]
MKQNRIIRNTFYSQLLAFVLSSLASAVGTIIDGVVIGQCLGADSIAAFGIVSPLMIVFALGGAVVSTGARNRFARLVGSGELERAQGVFSLACVMAVGIGVLMLAVCLPLAAPIARMLGATGKAAHLLGKAKDYLVGVAIGLPAMNAMRILWAFMPIDNDKNLPIVTSAALTLSDVALDLLAAFVFHGDTFEMGLATSISYYVAVGVLMTHFRKKHILLKLCFRRLPWRESWDIVKQGLPVGAARLGNTVRSAFMNQLLAAIASSAAIAAYSVHRQADIFLNPIVFGVADTVAVLAGVLAGEENRPAMKRLLGNMVMANLTLSLGAAALTWVFAPQFAGLYITDQPEALSLSVRAVRCYALGMPLYGLSMGFINYTQGIGKNRLSSLSGILSEAGFLILSAAVLSRRFGADAVWYAFPVTQLLMLLYHGAVVLVLNRKPELREMPLSDRILLLPRDFDAADGDRLDRSITTAQEVVALSQEVWAFCEAHGCDRRRRYLMALSVEEMAGNVVEHGFTKDKKPHSIDVRILKKGDEYIVRIRDDCVFFDPLQRLQLYSDRDPAHHMGLRMIIGTAKELRYTCILRLNNLVVRI